LHVLVDERLDRDLAATADDQQRVGLCRELMTRQPGDFFYQAACLRRIVSILGTKAFDDVASALGSENEVLRRAAIQLGTTPPLKRLSEKWSAERDKSDGVKRAAITEILAADTAG
jgi:hypothetical protein